MNDEMPESPLTDAARQALEAERALTASPTDEQRLRMKAAVLARLGAVGTTGATAAKLAGGTKSALASKVLVGLALVGAGAVAVTTAALVKDGAPANPPHVEAPASAAPTFSPPPSLTTATSAAPPEPSAPAPSTAPSPAPPRPSAISASSAPPSDDVFAREVTALRQAQLELQQGRPASALDVLRPWTGTDDPLRDERWATQVVALCSMPDRRAEGQRQRAAFLHILPTSPLASRVRSACPGAERDAGE